MCFVEKTEKDEFHAENVDRITCKEDRGLWFRMQVSQECVVTADFQTPKDAAVSQTENRLMQRSLLFDEKRKVWAFHGKANPVARDLIA